MKRCTKCGVEKEEKEFNRDKTRKDGLDHWCKACRRAFVRTYGREARRDPNHPAHRNVLRHDLLNSQRVAEARKNPEHSYTWSQREINWRQRKVECVPGCVANDGFLCSEHYNALWAFQEGRCALCGGLLARGMKPYPAADHWHRDPDGRGPIRGLLHGGKTGCNIRILGAFEAGRKVPDEALEIACHAYLDNPPSSRMVGSSWSRTPQPVPKYLGSEV